MTELHRKDGEQQRVYGYHLYTPTIMPGTIKRKQKKVTSLYHRLTNAGGADTIRSVFKELEAEKKKSKWQWICFNDLMTSFTEDIEEELFQGFEKMFPNKALFER
mmetsp:Transcript_8133/g.9629  ORF Transcript_8133/g.9629 Transcript_8133/m.9629 type:complete len:105 (-) Transcript_8133:11-325(-)